MTDSTDDDLIRASELNRLGRPREALDLLDRVLGAQPAHPRALSLRSLFLVPLGEYDAAIAAARASVAADPQYYNGFWALSFALDQAGQGPEAVEAAATAVRLKPDVALNHVRLAEALIDTDPPAAVAPAERARELAPGNALTHVACGAVYEMNQCPDEARQSYLRALEIDPQTPNAHFRIALLDKQAGKGESALRGFRRAATLNPKASDARKQIELLIYQRLGSTLGFAFMGAMVASYDTGSAHDTATHIGGAVLLGIIGGVGYLNLRNVRRVAGSFLRHCLRTDRHARGIVAMTSAYILYIVAVTQTPLIHAGGYFHLLGFIAVIFPRIVTGVLNSRAKRRSGQPAAGRKGKQKAGAQQLKDGTEA